LGAKLIVLPGVGHMVQNAAPGLIAAEIDAMMERIGRQKEVGADSGEQALQQGKG
jgi:hypothetical protein